jgi:hypothetical protein
LQDSSLTLLLAERRRFSGQAIAETAAKLIGRADRYVDLEVGELAQLNRHVSILPRAWPMAAIMRQYDAGDAENYRWLRADPAYVRAEMGVVRLLSVGDAALTQSEAEQLIKPLKVLFGDNGFLLSAPAPDRWYLMIPRESKLPEFKAPSDALGADIFSTLPQDDLGKRWRMLLNEAQIILHNHLLNIERQSKNLLSINSLYFWGAGVLPDQVKFHADSVISEDMEVKALLALSTAKKVLQDDGPVILDLRREREWKKIEMEYFLPNHAKLNRRYRTITLDFADGAVYKLEKSQKWRFWRKPLRSFA